MGQRNSHRPRIVLIASPGYKLPPEKYGGTERCLWELMNGLIHRDYHVTLMAGKQAAAPCQIIRYSQGGADQTKMQRGALKLWFFARLASLLPRVDIIHSHHRSDYLLPALLSSVPTVQTYHGPLDPGQVEYPYRLSGGRVHFTGISNSQTRSVKHMGKWTTIYHGLDCQRYTCTNQVGDAGYLVFLGRIWKPKGLHTAIAVAKATNSRLLIAGNIVDYPDDLSLYYFQREIAPLIDGQQIQYVGEVDDVQKNSLLGGAKALLMPIEWDEPFGLVMIEAMACGTPVVAFNRGSVPEVVSHGVNGFICHTMDEMIAAVNQVTEIDRAVCRKTVETEFSTERMVDRYEALYQGILAQ